MNDSKLMNRAADNIRILAASMVEKANSGHPGGNPPVRHRNVLSPILLFH